MATGTITKDEGAAAQGPVFIDRVHHTGDGSYPTGGTPGFQALLQAKIGASKNILGIIPADCGIYVPSYDIANDTLKVRTMVDGTEVANTTNLGATTFNYLVISI